MECRCREGEIAEKISCEDGDPGSFTRDGLHWFRRRGGSFFGGVLEGLYSADGICQADWKCGARARGAPAKKPVSL